MAKDSDKKTLRDWLRVVFRRRILFLVGTAVFAVGWLVAAHFVLPMKYTATTIFERRSDPASQEQASNAPESVRSLQLTMPHDLKGYDAVAQAAEDLGLIRGLPHDDQGNLTAAGEQRKQEIVLKLVKSITVTSVESPAVDRVSVSFTDDDPELVQQLPDTLVRNYISRTSEMIVERLRESQGFLVTQVDDGKRRLSELTARKIEFETKNAGMLPDDPGELQDTLDQISTDIDSVRRQQTVAGQTVAKLKEMAAARKPKEDGQPVQTVKGPNPELTRLKGQLEEAKEQLETATTLNHMTEKHPTVITLRRKVEDLETRIEGTDEEAVLHTVYGSATQMPDNLDVQLAAAESAVDMTTNELERLDARQLRYQNLLANFGPIRREFLDHAKKMDEQEAETKRWEERLTEVEMALAAEVAQRRTHMKAVQVAQPQYKPSSPKLTFVLGVAIVGGLAFGGGLVFLLNVLDRAVRTTEDAAVHFGLPIYGVIDEIVTPRELAKRKWTRRTIGTAATVVALAALALSCMSIVLWLEYPDQHEKWKADPVTYLSRQASEKIEWLKSRMM